MVGVNNELTVAFHILELLPLLPLSLTMLLQYMHMMQHVTIFDFNPLPIQDIKTSGRDGHLLNVCVCERERGIEQKEGGAEGERESEGESEEEGEGGGRGRGRQGVGGERAIRYSQWQG